MKRLAFFIGIGLTLFLSACSNRSTNAPPGSTETIGPQTGIAEITRIEVLPIDSAEKVQRILIQGTMPSSCAALGEVTTEHSEQVFIISANYTQSTASNCSNTPQKFGKVVELDISQLSPGDYLVEAGSLSNSFTVSDNIAAAEPTSADPTPMPQLTESSVPSAVASAATPTLVPNVPRPGGVANDCVNKVAFYADVTIPDGTVFNQGEAFTKIWQIRNEGTCTITSEYSLVFAAGDPLDGPLTSPMPDIAPGETADISINLAAPKQGGKYGANYEFRDPTGNRFGVNSNGIDYIWVEIVVDWGNSQANTTESTTIAAVPVSGNCSFTENPGYLDTILNLVNAARSAEGVAPLTANSALMAAAKVHSIDMGCNNFLDHTGSDGSKARTRIIGQGYNPSYAAENIYAGATEYGADAQGAYNWWMNSPVHRKNILNPRPTEVGIGFVNVPSSSFGGYYTMVFATP
ncbi:MAG TPA: NBR1-Ig-like domain-containing protein [Bellilinea sp.]|nr:NBR1-Ig-like domain-containing protein [Bellilinea sp.]